MRPRDGGLVAHGVWTMRVDKAAQWLLQEWATGGITVCCRIGRQAVSQSFFLVCFPLTTTPKDVALPFVTNDSIFF